MGVADSAAETLTPARLRRRGSMWWWLAPVLGVGLFFMLLVPQMCRPRESANIIKCSSNLRQMGLAIKLYADGHNGVLPASWKDLATAADVTADVFVCPSSADDRDSNAKPDDPVTWAGGLDDPAAGHCSYRYAGNGLNWATLAADDVLAFESTGHHGDSGVNILYGDGRVEWSAVRDGHSPEYDRLLADHAAGVRPLRWKR